MKPLSIAVLASCICLFVFNLWYFTPGGPGNPHDWISEHYTPAPEVKPDPNCKASGNAYCMGGFKDEGFYPLRISLSDNLKHSSAFWTAPYPKIRPGCWNVDFCTKHSEVRVTPCEVK